MGATPGDRTCHIPLVRRELYSDKLPGRQTTGDYVILNLVGQYKWSPDWNKDATPIWLSESQVKGRRVTFLELSPPPPTNTYHSWSKTDPADLKIEWVFSFRWVRFSDIIYCLNKMNSSQYCDLKNFKLAKLKLIEHKRLYVFVNFSQNNFVLVQKFN